MEQIQFITANLLFPIVVCFILLTQYRKAIEKLAGSLDRLSITLEKFLSEARGEIRKAISEKCPASSENIRKIIREEIKQNKGTEKGL